MSEKLKSKYEQDCELKIQDLRKYIQTTQAEIIKLEKEIAEAAAARIIGFNPFGQVYLNLKRKNGECYSILSSADYHTNECDEESICLRGVDIICDSGMYYIEETYEEIYNLENFKNIFKLLGGREYVDFVEKYRWLFVPIEKFLIDFKGKS